MTTVRCPSCGTRGSGSFCSQCGASLTTSKGGTAANCGACGAELAAGTMFCGECGGPTGARSAKPLSARLPWIVSAAALVIFSGLIAWLVQGGSSARQGDDPITGGIGAPGGAAPTGGTGTMLTPEQLAAMSPREAADRLFDRAMREHEGGSEQGAFFSQMAIDAYGGLPPAEMDPDAYFHIGLLRLLQGDAAAAREVSDAMLVDNPNQLYGLLIGARAAALEGNSESEAEYLQRTREAIAGGESLDDPVYSGHRPFIESQLADPNGAP